MPITQQPNFNNLSPKYQRQENSKIQNARTKQMTKFNDQDKKSSHRLLNW